MTDAASQLRSAARRAKSDVANKLVSMFLHELSRKVSEGWGMRVDGEEYEHLVRQAFENRCPYCLRALTVAESVVEHLDGMNRYRAGLHVPGNVLVACKRCNSEKRRDDSAKVPHSPSPAGLPFFLTTEAGALPHASPVGTGKPSGRMMANGVGGSPATCAGSSRSRAGLESSSGAAPS